jgi:hypothetical protein
MRDQVRRRRVRSTKGESMSDAFWGGFMIAYMVAGVYVWWLGLPWGRKWLALMIMLTMWPLFLCDIDIKKRR